MWQRGHFVVSLCLLCLILYIRPAGTKGSFLHFSFVLAGHYLIFYLPFLVSHLSFGLAALRRSSISRYFHPFHVSSIAIHDTEPETHPRSQRTVHFYQNNTRTRLYNIGRDGEPRHRQLRCHRWHAVHQFEQLCPDAAHHRANGGHESAASQRHSDPAKSELGASSCVARGSRRHGPAARPHVHCTDHCGSSCWRVSFPIPPIPIPLH